VRIAPSMKKGRMEPLLLYYKGRYSLWCYIIVFYFWKSFRDYTTWRYLRKAKDSFSSLRASHVYK